MPNAPYTSPLAEGLAPDVLDRFTRYVRIDTQSRRERESSPSTPGQLELGRLLAGELRAAGLEDAELDENGYVMATLPATAGPGAASPNGGAPVIGLIAHVDTSPDAPGRGVEPIVHREYDGGVIELPRDGTTLEPETMPELADKLGHDIITASGDTLLGADDKAGVAEIMAAVAHLAAHPELPRPTVRVAFTPDEEIGLGASLFDLDRFGAACAYTLDGSELGELQDESFSALEALLTIHGVEVHPGQADQKLVNALRLAAKVIASLPDELTPERSSGREGFIHPYELTATTGAARVRLILRDFDENRLRGYAELLERTVADVLAASPRARYELDFRRQYRNMREYLDSVPAVLAAADEAIRAEGIEPVRHPIRGGTDGSLLSEMGLPTPNLFTGGYEYHSPREWASLQEMAAAAATLVRLAEVWTQPRYADALRPRTARASG
ncbi:MAG TPA: peptidase T [Solirubrobacteraceae bacterium]